MHARSTWRSLRYGSLVNLVLITAVCVCEHVQMTLTGMVLFVVHFAVELLILYDREMQC